MLIRPRCSLIRSATPVKLGPLYAVREARAKLSEYSVLGYFGAAVFADKHQSVANLFTGERVAYRGEGMGHAEYALAGENLAARILDGVSFGPTRRFSRSEPCGYQRWSE